MACLKLLLPILLAAAPQARADVGALFSYVAPDAAPAGVGPNGTILMPSAQVNQTTAVTLIATNTGQQAWHITDTSISGPPFKASQPAPQVAPNSSVLITISFSPTKGGAASGTFVLSVSTDATPTAPAGNASFLFVLKGTGLAPNFVPSYILNPAGNQLPLLDGGAMAFTPTAINQTATATVIIANTGTGFGVLSSVGITGDGFQLAGLPLIPFQVAAQADVRFTVVFAPKAGTSYQGTLTISLDGAVRTLTLTGAGLAPQFAYATQVGGQTVALAPGGTLTIMDTAVGGTIAMPIRVRNTGSGDGQVATIKIMGTGTAFTLANLPLLPATVPVGQSFTFNVVFQPSDVGLVNAQLFIDNTAFLIAGTGLGPKPAVTVDPGNGPVAIAPNGTILFANTAVGSSAMVLVSVANAGNASLTINSITVSGDVFTPRSVPTLPASLDPGQNLSFTLVFTPNALQAAAGSLQIDNMAFALRGAATPPPALPPVSFTALPATVGSSQQPAIGLQLARPYPLDISGVLTLTFSSSVFGDDTAIQFATGGRNVNFRIPANTTNAIFGQAGTMISLQTGTVAGNIALAATLTTASVDLTPTPAPTFTTKVAGEAPVIRSVQLGRTTATGFELLITGYSNMRSVSSISLQFTGSPGANLQTSSLNLDTNPAFSAWYQSASSWTFGSQFTASVFINVFSGKLADVQSVSVTAGNSLGTSAPVSAGVQ